jgi:UDP-glucose:(heptosyl)LPS alpha-1,3-glucosyltransferase
VAEGWEVHFFGHSWDGEPEAAIFHPIRQLPKWVPPSLRIFDFALQHRKLVGQDAFDIILGFGNTIEMNVYQSHGGVHYTSNIKKLGAVRSPLIRVIKTLLLFATPKYHARAYIESSAFRRPNHPTIVAISGMVRDDMSRYFRVPKDEIKLVYNGVDVKRFGAAVDPAEGTELRQRLGFDREVLFLFMAYDFKKKGVRFLVEAAAALRDRVGNAFGVVVVGGQPSPSLQRLAHKLHVSDIIKFPGPTQTPELFYYACDAFVLPTFYDACSLVVFEAMAAGLPAITTVHNGAAGIIEDGVDGKVLYDPANIDEMARALEWLLDPDVLARASELARKKASEYTSDRNHRQMLAIFKEALKKRS